MPCSKDPVVCSFKTIVYSSVSSVTTWSGIMIELTRIIRRNLLLKWPYETYCVGDSNMEFYQEKRCAFSSVKARVNYRLFCETSLALACGFKLLWDRVHWTLNSAVHEQTIQQRSKFILQATLCQHGTECNIFADEEGNVQCRNTTKTMKL